MINGIIRRRLFSVLLTAAMLVTMMPYLGGADGNAYAEWELSVPGGAVSTDSELSSVFSVFGGENPKHVEASRSGDTLSIKLLKDMVLESPLLFKKGESGNKIILDLNGYHLTGAPGETGSDRAQAEGNNTIEIIPNEFNVEIRGRGAVIGGKGAVIEDEDSFRHGAKGGAGILLTANDDDSYWNPNTDDAKLKYGLTVTDNVSVIGGDGADLSGNDWLYTVNNCQTLRYDNYKNPQFTLNAGRGGDGIGQKNAGVEYGQTSLAYYSIIIENGSVEGGAGGVIDLSSPDTPVMTHYGLMNNPVIDQYMQGIPSNRDRRYDDLVTSALKLKPGDGGAGIKIGSGRKYLRVDQFAEVQGGICGDVDYGNSKMVNCFVNEQAEGGVGIDVYGDIGLKNVDVDFSDWESKTQDSDDMGIYIAGKVIGGASPDADAMNEMSGIGGTGIQLSGNKGYFQIEQGSHTVSLPFPLGEEPGKWGIVMVAESGEVTGGNAGNSIKHSAGAGGDGIYEPYTKSDDLAVGDSVFGTDYYIVNGKVKGGSGGDSFNNGGFGSGGNGISFNNYRIGANIVGIGSASGGDCGVSVYRNAVMPDDTAVDGIRIYPDSYYDDENNISLVDLSGSETEAVNVDNSGLSVTAAMSPFRDYPTTATHLNCTVNKPADYTGNVYVKWFAELKLQNNTAEVCALEPADTDPSGFNLISNEAYKYLAYETYEGRPDLGYSYNVNVATVDRINEVISHSNSYAEIYCEVQLEDGRWAESNVMHFTKEGWSGNSEPDPSGEPSEEDRAAAGAVQGMINTLDPAVGGEITLDDEQWVNEIRAEYEALTDVQKSLVDTHWLVYAENEIYNLNESEAARVIGLIEDLPAEEVFADLTDEDAISEVKNLIVEAINAYNDLTDTQKGMVDISGSTYYLNDVRNAFNTHHPESAIDGDVIPPEPVDPQPEPQPQPGPNVNPPAPAAAGPAEIQDLPAVKIAKPKAAKKKVTVKWKKVSKKNLKKIQGIEIHVVGPGVDKTVTAGKKKTSKKVGGLQSKQKYTVQVRAYAWIGGVKHVSAWKSKSVKIK